MLHPRAFRFRARLEPFDLVRAREIDAALDPLALVFGDREAVAERVSRTLHPEEVREPGGHHAEPAAIAVLPMVGQAPAAAPAYVDLAERARADVEASGEYGRVERDQIAGDDHTVSCEA